jgi:enoyl-CoA hydratase/carnithine racemase
MEGSAQDYAHMAVEGLSVAMVESVLTIAFDRPLKRNAMTYEMYDAMTGMLDAASRDNAVCAVLFTGKGEIFTAGHDVSGFARGLSLQPEEKPSFGFMHVLSSFAKPVIAAVNGDAVGIGATMLFHCDFVYAANHARLKFPFMQMGLIPEFGTTFLGPRLFGHKAAMDLFILDGWCSAGRAVELGIANRAVPLDGLMDHALSAGQSIARLSPDAVRETKRLMKEPEGERTAAAILAEAHAFHDLLKTDFVKDIMARRSGAK